MKILFKSFCSALLMYSRIPAPNVEWKEKNRKYSLCFFPFVGAVICALFILWRYICDVFAINQFIFSAFSACIPLIVTGGIHMDGYCDVNDALSSCTGKEKSLEIMKDPHIGSFAVMKLVMYILIQSALFSEVLSLKEAIFSGIGFIVSRAFSGIAAVNFKAAKKNGSLQDFTVPADRKITSFSLYFVLVICILVMMVISPISSIVCICVSLIVFFHYKALCMKKFGGITGDCSGWFLQREELFFLAAAVFSI